MSLKAGLDSAVDTTKLVVTLDGALIAFVTGTAFLGNITTGWEKWSVFASLVFLSISLVGGLMVLLEAGTMYSSKNYGLGSKLIKFPGIANLIGFALGATAVGAMAAFTLIFRAPAATPPPSRWQMHCAAAPKGNGFDCSGTPQIVISPSKDR
jgi:hypothetical protein